MSIDQGRQRQLGIVHDALFGKFESGRVAHTHLTSVLYDNDNETIQCIKIFFPSDQSATLLLYPDGEWRVFRGQ